MAQSIHEFHDDPRNDTIRIWIDGVLRPRAEATVSVFDAGFVLGDGVWEGFRLVGGKVAFLDVHLEGLYEGAASIDIASTAALPPLAAAGHDAVRTVATIAWPSAACTVTMALPA